MSITYRKDRKRYELALHADGKRSQRILFPTFEEAERAEIDFKMRQLGIHSSFTPTKITQGFKKYFDEVSPEKAKLTHNNEKRWFRLASYYFLAEENLIQMDEIKLEHLEGLQRWLQKDNQIEYFSEEKGEIIKEKISGVKPQTVNRMFASYRNVFKKMRKWKRINEDPCEFLEPLDEKNIQFRKPWSNEEVGEVFKACPKWFRPVFRMVYYYGARPSSLARLTWPELDFERSMIFLDSRKGCKAEIKIIPLPMIPPMRRELLRLKKVFPFVGKDQAVFRDDSGVPLTAGRMSKIASKIIKECGYDLDFYALKHTLANDLRRAGVALEDVKDLLGHTDTRATRIYCNEIPVQNMISNLLLVRGKKREKGA